MKKSPDNAFDPQNVFDPQNLAGLTSWVVTDGKAGDEAPCFGLAFAMGLWPQKRVVRPRALFAALAPRGPVDPRERPNSPDSPLAGPYPDILIASGRRAVPYMRHVKRASGGKTFTIFLKDPRVGARVADMLWVADHDYLRGPNVITSLTAPHLVSAAALEQARAAPDPRIAALPEPRVALLVGGDSHHHRFDERDRRTLVGAVESILLSGASAMITRSRRTPPEVMEDLRRAASEFPERSFLWDGTGANPYLQMLAHASTIIVTADSTNMVGEAAATSAPVMVYEPSGGGHPRFSAFLDSLQKVRRIRRWLGRLESWPCEPLDSTQQIADEMTRRYAIWRAARKD